MEYLPFEVTEYNDLKEDIRVTLHSDTGVVWVRVGKLDIEIKQTDDGQGVIIQALDAELCEQDLGSIQVWYDDIEELPNEGDYPIH
jgi:hypothetical protein